MDKDKIIAAFKKVVDRMAQTGDRVALDALELYRGEIADHEGLTGAVITITDSKEPGVIMEFTLVPTAKDGIHPKNATFAQFFGHILYGLVDQTLKQGSNSPLGRLLLEGVVNHTNKGIIIRGDN